MNELNFSSFGSRDSGSGQAPIPGLFLPYGRRPALLLWNAIHCRELQI